MVFVPSEHVEESSLQYFCRVGVKQMAKYFLRSIFEDFFFFSFFGIINGESASLESRMKDKDLQNGWNTDGTSNACT